MLKFELLVNKGKLKGPVLSHRRSLIAAIFCRCTNLAKWVSRTTGQQGGVCNATRRTVACLINDVTIVDYDASVVIFTPLFGS